MTIVPVVAQVQAINFGTLRLGPGGDAAGRDLFEDMVVDLVAVKHPGARGIEAAPGDWGIDARVGNFEESLQVWQCKYFIDEFGAAQQAQVREAFDSLVAAAKKHKFKVDSWTLCVPIQLPPEMDKWWDTWKKKQEKATGIVIELWSESSVRGLLLKEEAAHIRAHYFPYPGGKPLERPLEDPDADFEDALFVAQLRAAGINELSAAKKQYYNAQLLIRDVGDKSIKAELTELEAISTEVHGIWEERFNSACSAGEAKVLLGLHPSVMDGIRAARPNDAHPLLRAGMTHTLGLMHDLVDGAAAGWVRNFREIAEAHGS